MNLYIPVYKKMNYRENVIVERSLPEKGDVVVKKGDKIVPFTKIGRAKVSKESFPLPQNIRLGHDAGEGSFVYEGEKIGTQGLVKKVIAPYNGFITKRGKRYYFNQEKSDVWELSGLWGYVEDSIGDTTVNIRTQAVDINFIAYSKNFMMGELIVFPNPSELLDMEYLQNFSNNVKNKIVYVGHHIRAEVYERAVELNVGALIAGSIDKKVYEYTKTQPVSVGITSGFGNFSTPLYIFEYLKTISNRHVFFDGKRGVLQVPMPFDNPFEVTKTIRSLRLVEKGLSVLIFDKLHFGLTGDIEDVQGDTIYVKLYKSDDVIETKIPNIFALV